MPDRVAENLILFIRQNNGTLSSHNIGQSAQLWGKFGPVIYHVAYSVSYFSAVSFGYNRAWYVVSRQCQLTGERTPTLGTSELISFGDSCLECARF
jgi:hypothetical protein